MSDVVASTPETASTKKPPGLAELISRVLEQLAVSAWLPAAMLIGIGSLIVQLRIDGDLDVAAALGHLGNPESWGIIIILLFGLILTTMVTQAFSFGTIRLLEGYWGSGGRITGWLLKWCVRAQVKRATRVRERTSALESALFKSAIPHLAREKAEHQQVWNEQLHVPKRERKQTDRAVIASANAIDWRRKGDPGIAALFSRAHDRQVDYPDEPTRTLPTRLGNVLRSSEDRLGLKGHALERFIMENYKSIPTRLMTQHDQFRDRLDMYALLTLVFAALAAGSVPLLWGIPSPLKWLPTPALSFAVLAFLSWMSYLASIASARGYGSTLLAINRTIKRAAAQQKANQDGAPAALGTAGHRTHISENLAP